MLSLQSFPSVTIPRATASYCVQVGDHRIVLDCGTDAFYDRCFDYQFENVEGGVLSNSHETGEIHPISDSFYVIDDKEQHPGWIISVNLQIWPKSELAMDSSPWQSENELTINTIRSFNRPAVKQEDWPDYTVPVDPSEVDIVKVQERCWSLCEFGDFSVNNALMTELSEQTVLFIVFNTASFWQRKTYPPEGLKDHLKPLFIDYLSRIQIILTEGVPEAELPPLGFYPSKREEKEIDSEGNTVVEGASSTSSSEWGW